MQNGLQIKCINCPVKNRFDLAKHSTIGCGGWTKIAYFPRSIEEVSNLIQYLTVIEREFYAVGNMSNVLPSDGQSKRVFVCMKGIKEVRLNENFFGAGLTSGELLRLCSEAQLGGLEFLQGIPTTLGGALFMNAGVENAHIGDLVQDVLVHDGKSMRRLPKEECDYAYKHSVFMQNGWTILGAYLRLEQCSATEIEERLQYYTQRRGHLPKGKSMGCVFKNPDGVSAGKLIEGAGLKGLRIGGAVVSDIHANFILNDKGATSQQIKTLIGIIKNAVFAQYRIKLEEEIRYLE